MPQAHQAPSGTMGDHPGSSYRMLALNLLLSGLAMYFAMFAMIDGSADFFNNLNTLYMTGMMLAPMAVLMVMMMPAMYRNFRRNLAIVAGAVAVFLSCFGAIRTQAAIGDRQFVRSMIPHHSGAILMCRKAKITDPELAGLCREISAGQRREIAQMNRILRRL